MQSPAAQVLTPDIPAAIERWAPEFEERYAASVESVEGWLAPDEAALLFALAADRTSALGGAPIVEIGSAWGKSTSALAFGAAAGGTDARVFAVDPHTGGIGFLKQRAEQGETEPFSSLAVFRANMRRLGMDGRVDPVVLTSAAAAAQWDGRPLSVLWIDGWHTYDAVTLDIRAWGEFVAPGGVIALHDCKLDDVRRAAEDGLESTAWTRPRTFGRAGNMMWSVRR